MKNIHIENSYKVWSADDMQYIIMHECYWQHGSWLPEIQLNRTYFSMCVEWWLHNIGYYVTKPFCFIEFFKKINLRCKDVDLNEHG